MWRGSINEIERKREIIRVDRGTPQVGALAFGIVDRGTNIIEVRPTTLCPLSCIYCSVNAGPRSTNRWAEFIDDPEALLMALEEVVRFKGTRDIEVHIDGMGEPGVYPYLVDLVRGIKTMDGVSMVSMQTRLYMFTVDELRELARAGLDRINLSIDTLNPGLAKKISGAPWYDIDHVKELVVKALELGINVIASPVWLPGINDDDIIEVIKWARELGLGRGELPPVLIQKYVPHKRGRKVRIRVMTWQEFWGRIKKLEGELGVRLTAMNNELNIHKAPKLPKPYNVGDYVKVRIISRGIIKGEFLGVILPLKDSAIHDRVITVIADPRMEKMLIGNNVKVRIIENDNNIYIGKLI
ncbi:radical SAM protein [Vulcanisaeta sp. JCM 16159]|uniref:radical SAM protein n=1 Tax=Vulcanisaeta sp. JCM 16159 TaxID=1295371 RepID=UPI0006D1C3D1|nr:radical SAM protein [Vulcanisaeta sp. JCM 16159]